MIDCYTDNNRTKRCTECCQRMTFILQPPPDLVEKYSEFYRVRGATITEMPEGAVAVTVPSPCPHLSTNGCTIQNSKPVLCKEYDCRSDPFLKGGKYGEKK